MNGRLVSKYKNNVIASKKKHIYARLLDYFALFVVTYLLFTVFYAIAGRLPVIDNTARKISDQNVEIAEYIDSTHLQRLNEKRTALLSVDDGAIKYVESIAKTSAYVHDLTFPVKNEEGTFNEVVVSIEETFVNDVINYDLDDLSHYYKVFKKNDPSLNNYTYESVDYKDDIDTYLYLKIMKVDATKFVSSDNAHLLEKGNGISQYTVLTEENTKTLLKYFKEDRANTSLYNEIYLSFINGAKYGIKDVEKNSSDYASLMKVYNEYYQSLSKGVFVVYLISYTFAYAILTLIMRLIFKEWVTLGQKVMGLTMVSTDEMEPSVYQLIGYHVLTYLFFFTSSAIALYFMGMVGVLSSKIFGVVSLLSILLGLLIFNVVSLFMPLFNRNNHDLSTLISRINFKDTKEFEGPVEDNNHGRDEE